MGKDFFGGQSKDPSSVACFLISLSFDQGRHLLPQGAKGEHGNCRFSQSPEFEIGRDVHACSLLPLWEKVAEPKARSDEGCSSLMRVNCYC